MASLARLLDRLARPPEDIRADNLRKWRSSIAGTVAIADVKARQRGKVAGVIQNIRIDPRDGSSGSVEATIIDGTGQMLAKWLGRSSLSGIRLGAGLVMEGVCGTDRSGELIILNPDYELVPDPEHA